MANFIIDRRADTFREPLIAEIRGDSAHLSGHRSNDVVDLLRGHACVDFIADLVEDRYIDDCALLYTLDILFRLDQLSGRNYVPHSLITHDLFVKCQMATLILFSAAAPARCIPLKSSEHFNPLFKLSLNPTVLFPHYNTEFIWKSQCMSNIQMIAYSNHVENTNSKPTVTRAFSLHHIDELD